MRCKKCGTKFQKKYPNQMGDLRYCLGSDECTAEFWNAVKRKKIKDAQKKKRQFKKENKRKQDFEKDLEKIFNEFIRLRDKWKPCISCDAKGGKYTISAGHYFPAGSHKNVRFDEDNVHGQCWYNCNKNKSGNLSEYLPRLIERIGQERFDQLSERRNEPRRYTIPELKELIEVYKQKVKDFK